MTVEEKVHQLCALFLGEGDEIFRSSGSYSMDFVEKSIGERSIGFLSSALTDLNAYEGARTANQIQTIAMQKTRLKIPVLINDEALHGCKAYGACSFPQSIGMAATWNPQLMGEVAEVIGKETRSRGIYQVLSPVLDLARDPRHGRTEETYGEDPYLASAMGVAFVKGVQSQGVACTAKHFVANFVGDGGRDSGNINCSERELRELHLAPYEACIREANLQGIMPAYNAINGIPCSCNKWLLQDVLREEWGFEGVTVSDWSAINHVHGFHKVAESLQQAAKRCIEAGLDVDLPRIRSYGQLVELVHNQKLDEKVLDECVRRVLTLKMRLGLFENPYVDEEEARQICNCEEHRHLALKVAQKSIVLLKNDKEILPIKKDIKKVAVIGPNADELCLGGYSAAGVEGITVLQGIKNYMQSDVEVTYAKGCENTGYNESGFEQAIEIAKQAEICVLVVGGSGATAGECKDRIDLKLMGVQEQLIEAVYNTGKPVVVVVLDGSAVLMEKWIDRVQAVIMAWYPGEEGGNAIGSVLVGECNPGGKLPLTFPRVNGQIPLNYNHRPYGREGAIIDLPGLERRCENRYFPLFPFGYGLSYTKFEYENLEVTPQQITKQQEVNICVKVTNSGQYKGDEVVQLYLKDLYSYVTRPVKELKGFKRVTLEAGESTYVNFKLTSKDLAFLNEKMALEVEEGMFEVCIGGNCQEGLKGNFEVMG